LYVFKSLGFEDFITQISLRDPDNRQKYIGDDEAWEKAESAIVEATKEKGLNTITVLGEAAFYGPKLDFMVKDALKRSWQLGTIQVDYNLPKRFELEYIGADNQKHQPVMIHRAPFGSLERFVAILLEHTAGKFPLWLSPQQYIVLPISEKYADYANSVHQMMSLHDFTGGVDHRDEKIGRKIRDAEINKIPFMFIVGEKEADSEEVSVRQQGAGDAGSFKKEELVAFFTSEIRKSQSAGN
jgi:threonyl-tRNA synthetase